MKKEALERIAEIDMTVSRFLRRFSLPTLRISLAVVFIWFGALKVFDVTPVGDLVARTVYWFDPGWVVPILGVLEIAVGLGLLFKYAMRAVLGAFFLQLIGTFLVLLIQPDISFQDSNPLLLTVEGEFVIKNLVLIAAGMVVGATVTAREGLRTELVEQLPEP